MYKRPNKDDGVGVVERREGSGLLLRCRERRAGSPGCDGDGRGTTSKYYVGGHYVFF